MSKIMLFCLICLLLSVITSIAVAVTPTNVVWSLPPDMVHGMDFASEFKTPYAVADDWLAQSQSPITDIHWWGSYWPHSDGSNYTHYSDSLGNAPSGGISKFTLTIWSDVPKSDNNPFSHPDTPIWTYDATAYNETSYGTTNFGDTVYNYSVFLPENNWFIPEDGKVYWLSIIADIRTETGAPDTSKQWGWHESSQHWNDAAVQGFHNPNDANWGWYTISNNLYDSDMAFELTTVPEPGSMVCLASGLLGMVGLAYKRRCK